MHRTRLTGAPFTLAVLLASALLCMGCGGDDPVVEIDDPVEVDPWAGV